MKLSAGLLLYKVGYEIKFFLVHPGGPYFKARNEGWWTVPKGEPHLREQPLETAIRECEEETGYKAIGPFTELKPVNQKGGKKVMCWASPADLNPAEITCNTFELEWPPKSGKKVKFPEIDKVGWFTAEEAFKLINERQRSFIEEFIIIMRKSNKT